MKRIILFLAALSCTLSAYADEGMWMVNSISEALVLKMQSEGCNLKANEIYDVDKVSLKDAIVSLDFGCTGSLISPEGLLITNHHCAYSDVHAISTPEHNYLEDGYWALSAAQEKYIPGKRAYFLQKVLDVTDEVNALIAEEEAAGRKVGSRRLDYIISQKYQKMTGLEASLSSMWAGSKYYLALYKVYTDIRLVAAPPVSIAAFGGDIDNWEWPQHKCDFAMYRIYSAPDGSPAEYSEQNVPFHPVKWLEISTEGYQPGSFAMVLGYPGRTDRYSSSPKIAYQQNVSLPLSNRIHRDLMDIMKKWMDADANVRLLYADRFFELSNTGENFEGLEQCCERFDVIGRKKALEKRLLKGKDGRKVVKDLAEAYSNSENERRNVLAFRESLVRGSRIALIASRLRNHKDGTYDPAKDYETLDLRVEKELFRYSVEAFYENVEQAMWGPVQKKYEALYHKDYDALCDALWLDRVITRDDDLFAFLNEVQIKDYNAEIDKAEGEDGVLELSRKYTRALYQARLDKGELQYPDANSTMRLSFGTVGSFVRDGQELPWQTWSEEILAKEDSSYDFSLKSVWRTILKDSHIPVDFLTDNDITGGNSGSPVLDGNGRIIGLAFDGNKESLAGDVCWVDGYSKSVCVDIRFVLWTLGEYAGMDRILSEINCLPEKKTNMKTLVITDVQRDFFHPEGSLYVAGGEALPAKIAAVAAEYDKIIFTLDWHPGNHCSFAENGGPWPVHCVAYTQGAGLPDEFAGILALGEDKVQYFFKGCDKDREEYGAFDGISKNEKYAKILEWLKESDEVAICGIAGDYCVKETAKKLLNYIPAYKLKVLGDLICSIDDGSTINAFIKEIGQ